MKGKQMFSVEELKMIVSGLQMAVKSAQRLANREGQPETVAAEYRKVNAEMALLLRKAQLEMDKAAKAAKK